MLPGVSLAEANEFVDILYGRPNILSVISSDKHFTVTEDTGFTAEDILNNNSEGEDVKLEPCEVYDQVRCDECDKVFNSKNKLAQHVAKVHKFKDCVCDVCGKSFKKLSALESHKKTHQTVQCESCDKTFKLSTFYMHRKTKKVVPF